MSLVIDCDCDECQAPLEHRDKVFCGDCFRSLEKQIQSLQSEIESLKEENESLKNELNRNDSNQ